MYRVQFTNCRNQVGSVEVPTKQAYQSFATFADKLLLGEDMGIDFPDAVIGSHIVQVTLAYYGLENPLMVSSIFLICECDVDVEKGERATSMLMVPEKQIYVPGRTA
jgi:hypothetical protein